MKSREEILTKLTEILVEEFEIDAEAITPDANMYTDLDLDSIDTVDLVINLQEIIGKKIDPETFKSVRTIDSVVDAIEELVNN
ncbi:MAG: acyl carrier protein [Kangiellaceae bacterium]|jgi:acyl carrier protein